jgi:YgiT-type zinc finger domain-containing protein
MTDPINDEMICPSCGGNNITINIVSTAFQYGDSDIVPVQLPVRTCNTCEFEFCGYEAEEARDAAVKTYLSNKQHD